MSDLRFPFTAWLLGLLGLLSASFAHAKAPRKGLRPYTVQAGDSCWSISQKLFGNPKNYEIIHKHNKLGPMPHILKPGSILWIPGKLATPSARVTWLRRQVSTKPPQALDWRNAKVNMSLWQLYKISTERKSSARLSFKDRSSLQMRERSLVIIYGDSAKKSATTRKFKAKILVQKGVVHGGLASLFKDAGMNIQTPSSKVRLQSKNAQVEVDPKQTSSISVYQGKAKVKAQGKQVSVPSDYGTYVKKGKPPAKPRRLPPPPAWKNTQTRFVVLVPKGLRKPFHIQWKTKAGLRTRLEVSRPPKSASTQERFRHVFLDDDHAKPPYRLALKAGTYYARLSSITKFRLQSRPSKTLVIDIIEMPSSKVLRPFSKDTYETSGLLKISPPSDAIEVSIDGKPFQPFTQPLRFQTPKTYTLRFRSRNETTVSSQLNIRLLRISATLSTPTQAIAPNSKPLKLDLHVKDAKGQPSFPPGLQVHAHPGGKLPLTFVRAGRYTVTFTPPKTPTTNAVALVTSWVGGELHRASIGLQEAPTRIQRTPPPKAPKPPPFRWTQSPTTVEWGRSLQGLGLPSRAANTNTFFGLSSFAAQGNLPPNQDPKTRPVFLRMALRGALSLLSGRLALDADLPWLQSDIIQNPSNQSSLGDLRIGARWIALRMGTFLLTPSLRISLPTRALTLRASPSPPPAALTADIFFEPALILQWQPKPWLTLNTNQTLVLSSNFAQHHTLHYASSYTAAFHPFALLSIALGLDLNIGPFLSNPDQSEIFGLALSTAIRFHFQQFRLGIVGGLPLTNGANQTLGGATIGLTFDIGFRGP